MIAATTALLVALLLPAFDEHVAPNCGPAADVERRLRQQHGEEQVSSAITSDGKHMMERWESAETGSWTLVMRTLRGKLCVISAGEGWKEKPNHLRGTPS